LPKGTLVVPLHALPSRDWLVRFVGVIGRHYRFIGAAELDHMLHGGPARDACCHLTFDDGHETFYTDAMPVLADAGIPVSLFVSPAVIKEGANYWFQELTYLQKRLDEAAIRDAICEQFGCHRDQIAAFSITLLVLCMTRDDIQRLIDCLKRRHAIAITERFNMTADALREVARSPLVNVGAHTMRHPVLANESDERARWEIEASVTGLSDLLGRTVDMFAYPNGTEGLDFTGREQRVLRECGVRVAVCTDAGVCGPRTNPLAVPRGGHPSLEGEPAARMTARVLFPALYERLRRLTRRSDVSGAQDRRAIYARRLFPTHVNDGN
jgi:peptidoglycan/xylan/chitin deacetylase (PgdA/CDA1 family)